jgi:hypothetical protein
LENVTMRLFALSVVTWIIAAQTGCGSGSSTWTMSVENRGDVPCSVEILYGDNAERSARVDQLAKGKEQTLVGESVPTPIRRVKVTRGDDVQELKPDTSVPLGKRYAIVVGEDGKASGEIR